MMRTFNIHSPRYFQVFFPSAHQISNQVWYLYSFTTFLWVNVSMIYFFHLSTFSISVSFYFKCTAISGTSDALYYILTAHLSLGHYFCDQLHAIVMYGNSLGMLASCSGTHASTTWKHGEGNMSGSNSWPVGDRIWRTETPHMCPSEGPAARRSQSPVTVTNWTLHICVGLPSSSRFSPVPTGSFPVYGCLHATRPYGLKSLKYSLSSPLQKKLSDSCSRDHRVHH